MGVHMANTWSFLNDVRILDLSRLLPGPMATQLLADLGAEVIKIEEPVEGDTGRHLGKDMFARLNRNKKSLTLNLKSDEGKALFTTLIKSADAIVESFRPGVMERLGFSWEQVREINPNIVYCSLSGFGQTGPYAKRAGHDIDFLALSGYFGVPSQVNARISRPNVRLSDYAGAMYAALSMSIAIASSKQSGKGQYLDVAILDAITAWTAPLVRIAHEVCGGDPDKMPFVMPDNDTYPTKDGQNIAIGLFENKFWISLAELLKDEFPELSDERFATNRKRNAAKQETHALLCRVFASKTLAEWELIFDPTDLPWAPVIEDLRLFEDPHMQARDMFHDLPDQTGDGTSFQVRYPVLFSEGLGELRQSAPDKGQHTEDILGSIGLSPEDIAKLKDQGTV
ncbi:CaiB/BaiF CoA transferase family protein [Loktanella sp. Alg231-35]|uniref:CaiB/BaiF CoA transferase family protein n=1 Tax=Loktanella sp. Alg231-35 TaxID=1922220 RepID=UPI002795FD81|nr:CaiB/BaiF CoA-transferase family protein [Loktanella sp. Alg231-35]